jgi:hypothetical protein
VALVTGSTLALAPAGSADSTTASAAAKKKCKKAGKKSAAAKKKKCKKKAPSNTPGGGTTPKTPNGPLGKLAISPTSHDFGMVAAGSSSTAQAFAVTNTGGSTGVVTYTVFGANADDFKVSSDGCSGAVLTTGGGCSISVSFAPGDFSFGPRAGTLKVEGIAAPAVTASLAGFGTP